jgi:predicted peroxiredoxin
MNAHKLAILVWSISPEQPDLCAAPFVYSLAAAALDCEVEIHFAGPAVKLLEVGIAEKVVCGGGKTVYDVMREAAELGVKFLACSMAAHQHLATDVKLIPQMSGRAGATAFIGRVLDSDWRTLVF